MNPLPDLEVELANTRKVLERVPADKFDWTPHPKSKPLAWLATHVATLPGWITMTLTTDKLVLDDFAPPPAPKNTEELLAEFDKCAAECRQSVAAAEPSDLQQEWSCVYKGQELIRMPRAAVLRGMALNHLIHHRAQLTMYLRMADVAVPGLYGPSADEPDMFTREASA